jgi:CheY-like chemotaxis protein
MHGGAVRAESAGLGRGASFTVELPVRSPVHDLAPEREISSPSIGDGLLDGYRVVAVDDDPDTRDLLYSALLAAGADVRAAANADEALAACTLAPPDALVSDIAMPGRDGYALIREIQSTLGTRAPRVAVALSAYAAPRDRDRALEAGFQQHIAKPVDPEFLVRTLHLLLTQRDNPVRA